MIVVEFHNKSDGIVQEIRLTLGLLLPASAERGHCFSFDPINEGEATFGVIGYGFMTTNRILNKSGYFFVAFDTFSLKSRDEAAVAGGAAGGLFAPGLPLVDKDRFADQRAAEGYE